MDLELTEAEGALRDEFRRWLTENPPGPEPQEEDAAFAWRLEWLRRLNSGGWAAIHWPAEHGGRGASAPEQAVFYEELGRARAPLPANQVGVIYVGPTLMAWGTPEQQERHLPSMLSGDEVWCQGFSEPDAGSDLASIRTRAVRDGDDWIVSGQKVWTSEAQYAQWCILLARTDEEGPRHKGITYFLMDMTLAGIAQRPVRQITGESEFNELFLENVRIPSSCVVGGVGNGWKVAMTTLAFERGGLGAFLVVRTRQLLDELIEHAVESGAAKDPVLADRLTDLHMRCEIVRLMTLRSLTTMEETGGVGPEGTLVKLLWSATNQLVTEIAPAVVGPAALERDSAWAFQLLRARANTIEGGTTEILKNVVAERVLGLPRLRGKA